LKKRTYYNSYIRALADEKITTWIKTIKNVVGERWQTLSKIDEISREKWILGAFPEWGTWLNEEIDAETVQPGSFVMWWIGCTGLWIKSEANTNVAVDLWFGNGKRTQKKTKMDPFHQMRNMMGARNTQPNLRAAPIVFDPFAVTKVDAVLSTHYHNDHIDPFFAAAVLKNCSSNVPFIGPKESVKKWLGYGVPEACCKVVKPGDVVRVGDIEIVALDSFDRTCLVTADKDMRGVCPSNMDEKAVNYLIRTPAGSIYHSGDSHYSTYYAKHGKDYEIDVALGSYGENPIGCQDKMTSSDILRMAEALRCKVVIPFHHDVWTNFKADPLEIMMLYNYRKYVMQYQFTPFIWDVGGKFVYPSDKEKRQYHYRRGFEDCFTDEPNVPFRSLL
jgi:L-ascorbate 6-phosphate lactonase